MPEQSSIFGRGTIYKKRAPEAIEMDHFDPGARPREYLDPQQLKYHNRKEVGLRIGQNLGVLEGSLVPKYARRHIYRAELDSMASQRSMAHKFVPSESSKYEKVVTDREERLASFKSTPLERDASATQIQNKLKTLKNIAPPGRLQSFRMKFQDRAAFNATLKEKLASLKSLHTQEIEHVQKSFEPDRAFKQSQLKQARSEYESKHLLLGFQERNTLALEENKINMTQAQKALHEAEENLMNAEYAQARALEKLKADHQAEIHYLKTNQKMAFKQSQAAQTMRNRMLKQERSFLRKELQRQLKKQHLNEQQEQWASYNAEQRELAASYNAKSGELRLNAIDETPVFSTPLTPPAKIGRTHKIPSRAEDLERVEGALATLEQNEVYSATTRALVKRPPTEWMAKIRRLSSRFFPL